MMAVSLEFKEALSIIFENVNMSHNPLSDRNSSDNQYPILRRKRLDYLMSEGFRGNLGLGGKAKIVFIEKQASIVREQEEVEHEDIAEEIEIL